ncbi:lysophospholipid acyltransferase family protein [Vampirovibrio chlorellavorus]|uniref:lysophospholipid acyltransferase family protein n=1 Tax=Vampirovibrio chlorellavorus TaxID=758823 RepID=UPI0026F2F0DF|nr:lysophospholipid acyltransferase family protein [Vampirovibrio chlorellavorus]
MGIKLKNSRILKILLSQVAGQPLRWIRASWRLEGVESDPQAQTILDSGKPVIYALWHGRMYCLFKAVPLEKVAILVSPSNDGEFITRLARTIGFRHFVRGSHKRGGTQAILGLRKALLEDDLSIAFTVDGPRGPRYKVKPGIIRLASQTGAPIIPLGSATEWLLSKFDRAWDHYHAPMPFTKMRLMYGKPLQVPEALSDEQIQAYCTELESELLRVNLAADSQYGFHHQERL